MKRKTEQAATNSPSKKQKTAHNLRNVPELNFPVLPPEISMLISIKNPAAWLGASKALNEKALLEWLNNRLVDPKKQLLHLLYIAIQNGGYTAMHILIEHKEFNKTLFMRRHYLSCLENASLRGFHKIVLFLLQWATKEHVEGVMSAFHTASYHLQLNVVEVFIPFLKKTPGMELVIEAGLHNALFAACEKQDSQHVYRLLQLHEFRYTPLLDAFRKVCGPSEESKAIASLLRAKIAPHIKNDELNEIERQAIEWNSRYYVK